MMKNKKIAVVMPAYNAGTTLINTYSEIPHDIVDEVILVDDCSNDNTATIAESIGIKHIIVHDKNMGYGANQKSCYEAALALNSDIIIMLHPDYQYTPKLCTAMASLLSEEIFDCVLGSRILGVGALRGGMPLYKYVANRILTAIQNIVIGHKLSEYHTGYRAFTKEILERLPIDNNSNDFLFDNQMLLQIIHGRYNIGEITCPTLYSKDSSSISFLRSVKYGLGVLWVTIEYRLHTWKIRNSRIFSSLDD